LKIQQQLFNTILLKTQKNNSNNAALVIGRARKEEREQTEREIRTTQTFTYPSFPQLITSQGLVKRRKVIHRDVMKMCDSSNNSERDALHAPKKPARILPVPTFKRRSM
jgi:hypothetical protein